MFRVVFEESLPPTPPRFQEDVVMGFAGNKTIFHEKNLGNLNNLDDLVASALLASED